MVPSVSSVVSPMRHSRLALRAYRGMTEPGGPSNPRTPSGYHRTTALRDNVSVCLPIASPVATPSRQPAIRSFTVGRTLQVAEESSEIRHGIVQVHEHVVVGGAEGEVAVSAGDERAKLRIAQGDAHGPRLPERRAPAAHQPARHGVLVGGLDDHIAVLVGIPDLNLRERT